MYWAARRTSSYGERQSKFREADPALSHTWMGSFLDLQRDNTEQVYLRNRYYDPVSGRFTQEDPIGLAGGLNLYGFADGDPVTFSDPFGLNPCARGMVAACIRAFAQGVQTIGTGLVRAGQWMGGGWQRMLEAIRGASSAVPRLAQGPGIQGREMFREAVGQLKDMAGSGRADAFKNFAQQIGEATRGAWSATELAATNARVFAGQAGEAIVFDNAGNMFRGAINSAAFVMQKGGELLVHFDKLTPLQ